jgi:general secretion pathway protein F
MRKQVVNAALYPALVVSLGAAISCFLLLYVLPRFGRMYEGLQAGRSLPTELVLAASAALREHGWLVASATLAAGALLLAAWRGGHLQRALAALVRDVRPLHRQVFHFRTAQLFQALALLVRGGYTVDQALAVAASMDLGHDVRERIRVARAAVAEGKSLSTALAAAGLADITATRLLAVGERGGEIDRVLQTVGARHAGLFATFVERATRLVEPVLLLAVALVVGGLVLLMYMPIFDIAGGLGAGR